MAPRKKIIFLFRNDLRVLDNAALLAASKEARGMVIPLYVFDDKQVGMTARSRQLCISKAMPLKVKFLLESVTDLRTQLQSLSSNLLVRTGNTSEIVKSLAKELDCSVVYCSTETCSEEISVDRAIKKSLELKTVWTSTMVPLQDLPFDAKTQLPFIYSQYRKIVETNCEITPICDTPRLLPLSDEIDCGEIPSVVDLCGEEVEVDERSVLDFHGGSTSGLARLHDYCFARDLLRVYKETRNGMVGGDYSSKLSPWLSNGSVSPKQVYWEVKRYEVERVANESTYWLVFELMWRDYFKLLPLRVGTGLFRLNGPRNIRKRWASGEEALAGFHAWCNGTTGYSLIDANMVELKRSGFMSNRGRQIVASFLTKDLGVDWRWGAEWFEAHLIDHSAEVNWGNWAYSAGVGTDPREDRYFNLRKQAAVYDPEGHFVRHWLQNRASISELIPSILGLYAPGRVPSKVPSGVGTGSGGNGKNRQFKKKTFPTVFESEKTA